MNAPKVFLSHASEDKARFVLPFATAMREKGIEVWLDKWEILPGDSLVDKLFEEGLKEADAVLVVVSSASASKPWVKLELNTAVVNRITKQTKIIPVVLDNSEVPESLKSLVWESIHDVNDFEDELDRIVSAIFEHRPKPALGKPPSYVAERQITGLRQTDVLVLRTLYENAIEQNQKLWDMRCLSAKLPDIGNEVLLDSVEILEQQGYIKVKRVLGGVPRGIHILLPTLNGFMVFARSNQPEIEDHIQRVGLAILNENLTHLSEIARSTSISVFIVENLLDLFVSRGWIQISKSLSDTFIFRVTPSMRRSFE